VRIVSLYIARHYLRIFALCLGSFIAIYLVIDFLEKMRRFARYDSKGIDILLYFIYKVPEIVTQVTPLAVLMATLLSLGLLSRSSEIIALRSSGMSIRSISLPILTLAAIFSIITFFGGEIVVPAAKIAMRNIEEQMKGEQGGNTFFRQNNIWYHESRMILQARLFDPAKHTFRGVTLWQLTPNMVPKRRLDATSGTLLTGRLKLASVVERSFTNGQIEQTRQMRELTLPTEMRTDDLRSLDSYAEELGFTQLLRYSRKLRESGYDATAYLAQLHSRLSLPFASLVMAFLGIPFALKGGRSSGIAMGIGLSVAIGFAYFLVNAVLISLGEGGVLPPLVAAWAANIIFAATGVWLSMTVNN
jgi:lipopolysaccharide export system permease protein